MSNPRFRVIARPGSTLVGRWRNVTNRPGGYGLSERDHEWHLLSQSQKHFGFQHDACWASAHLLLLRHRPDIQAAMTVAIPVPISVGTADFRRQGKRRSASFQRYRTYAVARLRPNVACSNPHSNSLGPARTAG